MAETRTAIQAEVQRRNKDAREREEIEATEGKREQKQKQRDREADTERSKRETVRNRKAYLLVNLSHLHHPAGA